MEANQYPVVSVVINTYRHVDFITRAVESVLMQETDFPVEIIIGDDESDDGTREICIAFAEKYPDRIRLFLRSRKDVIYINGHPTGRFNFMENLKSARGKYIALLPGDDYWTDPKKLQLQVDFLEENSGFSLCFHNTVIRTENTGEEKLMHAGPLQETYETKDLLREWFISTSSIVFRRFDDFVFPDWFLHCQSGDIPLLLLLSLRGKFRYIDRAMSVYRYHPKGISWTHYGYSYAIGMTYLYQCFNIHTGYKFRKEIENAIIYEYRRLLPEILELNTLKKKEQLARQQHARSFRGKLMRLGSKIKGMFGNTKGNGGKRNLQ